MAPRKRTQLSPEERDHLAEYVGRIGRRDACERLKISDHTLVSALAGVKMHASTVELVRLKLVEVEDE